MEDTISYLITEGFVNEERFAKSFAGGKFRLKKWGRLKIENELRKRGLTDYCIKKGMDEIEDGEYLETAGDLFQRKWDSVKGNKFEKMEKVRRFMLTKGYEYEIIHRLIAQQPG